MQLAVGVDAQLLVPVFEDVANVVAGHVAMKVPLGLTSVGVDVFMNLLFSHRSEEVAGLELAVLHIKSSTEGPS